MAEITYSDDLLIKNNLADMIVNITAVDYDGNEKKVMILFDSNDNWSPLGEDGEIASVLGAFGASAFRVIQDDPTTKIFYVEFFQIINGEAQQCAKVRPFVRDGKRFRLSEIDKYGSISFLEENEV